MGREGVCAARRSSDQDDDWVQFLGQGRWQQSWEKDRGWGQVAGSPTGGCYTSPGEAGRGSGPEGRGQTGGDGSANPGAAGDLSADGALSLFLASVPLLHHVSHRLASQRVTMYHRTRSALRSTLLNLPPASWWLEGSLRHPPDRWGAGEQRLQGSPSSPASTRWLGSRAGAHTPAPALPLHRSTQPWLPSVCTGF